MLFSSEIKVFYLQISLFVNLKLPLVVTLGTEYLNKSHVIGEHPFNALAWRQDIYTEPQLQSLRSCLLRLHKCPATATHYRSLPLN